MDKKNLTPLTNSSKGNSNSTWLGNLDKYNLAEIERKKAEVNGKNVAGSAKEVPIKQLQTAQGANEQKQDCPFCHAEDNSFYLFPTRYAIARKSDALFPELPASLNQYVSDKNVTYSKYTLKFLNAGYFYAFVEYEDGFSKWLSYRVNDEGFLAKLKNINDPDCAPVPYGCKSEKHFANSSMICIAPHEKSKAKIVYLLFCKGFLSPDRLRLYKVNREQYAQDKKWQKIDLNAWRGSQKTSFCYNQQVFDKNVPTPNFAKYGKSNQTRKQKISEKFGDFPKAVCGVALYDALGISIDLNERRNDQFFVLTQFLNTYKDGISNHQRFNSIPLIESIEEGLKNKAIQSAKSRVEYRKNLKIKEAEVQAQYPIFQPNGFSHGMENKYLASNNEMVEGRKKYLEKYGMTPPKNDKQALEQRKEIIKQDAKEEERLYVERNSTIAENVWNSKYKPLLKYDEMQIFKDKIASLTKDGMQNAAVVGTDHLVWLKSTQLIKELHAFDPDHQKNGFIFYEYLMQALGGTGSTESGAKLIDGWITSKTVSLENIFMRAVLFNNKTAIAHYNEGTQGFSSSVVNYTDWTTAQGTYKQFMVTIAALDAAWDEWSSSDANKHYMPDFDKTFVGRAGRWSAEFIRVATQKAKTSGADRLIATQVCCFLYARTGIFNKGVSLHTLMLSAVPNFDPELKKSTEVSKTVEQLLNDKKNTGNTRIASFVMVLEAVNLLFQLSKPMSLEQKLQIWGGTCGLITASLEVIGVITATTKNAAHNLVKLAANSFAIVGSVFFTLYDIKGTVDNLTKDKFLAITYGTRSAAYFGLSMSYTKISIDFLQSIGNASKRPVLINLSKTLVKSNFYILISRLGTVVWLARFNLIILGLTAIEIIYKVYIADNELQDWCKKSAFGVDAVKFNNEGKELQEFNEAFAEVLGV